MPFRPHTTGLSSSVIARMIWLAASTERGVVLLLGVLAAEVRARRERATGAGEHHDPDVLTRRRSAQLLDRLDHHLAGERVELLRPVQRQPQGTVLGPDLQVTHERWPRHDGASGCMHLIQDVDSFTVNVMCVGARGARLGSTDGSSTGDRGRGGEPACPDAARPRPRPRPVGGRPPVALHRVRRLLRRRPGRVRARQPRPRDRALAEEPARSAPPRRPGRRRSSPPRRDQRRPTGSSRLRACGSPGSAAACATSPAPTSTPSASTTGWRDDSSAGQGARARSTYC